MPTLRPGRWPNVVGTTGPGSSPSYPAPSPLGPTHRTPDDDAPARKAARAVASATSPDDADVSSAPTSLLPLGSARWGFPLLSTVLRRHLLCAYFRQTGGNRPCRCRCHYRISPHRISLGNRIPHSRTRSRPSCTHRHQGPGRRPLAMIWQNLTRTILVLLCPIRFPSVRRCVSGACRHAHGYKPGCATQPPVFTGVSRDCGPGGGGVAGV